MTDVPQLLYGPVAHAAPLVLCFEVALDRDGANGGRIGKDWRLPPPWYVSAPGTACNAQLYVPAEETNDGIARNFYCDKRAGHPAPDGSAGSHRMVYDNDPDGKAFMWPVSSDASTPGSRATSTTSRKRTGGGGSGSDEDG